ncbi:MAG: chitobiase/beta-hexosaminidase C-terminal domain-containing protein, partial [Muribaculaceae bacterium]|nr:chitobiase/beta-hexosaminidase C-terminal domain-containing protein [Muribaculaceae bacterium]
GIVNFIDNRNIYIQDATGGICLFLNNNTVPADLALGDLVQAYGKRANYNGLAELSYINGSNSDEFSIISSGNTLPLAIKTIAEINEGGADALQCTRVKIEEATIGAINTSGNTPLTQGENSTNIYKVPALTGIEEGDVVDVIGVVGYFNAAQIRVATAADVVLSETPVIPDPVLTISVTELNEFRYIFGEGPSTAKTFTISGINLSNDVTLTAPQNYQLSVSPENGYFDTDELSPVNGTLDETTVYVRLKAGLDVGTYSGNLNIASGTLSYNIALSGLVDEQPIAATPIFSPVAGTYMTAQTVTISCETEGATIHYTTDGSIPTENSSSYNEPITVSATTTIKAMATAPGYANSVVAEATYTISETMTIAEARVLENGAYACVEGVVTFIDGRNVYIQDETAGIDLYLNNNTVPANLAIGDAVRAYGSKTVYKGLVELSGINGGDANAFSILTTGNDLPLAIQTIEAINSDFSGNNMLQSTRVKIEHAIIGAINNNGNTIIQQGDNTLVVYRIPYVEGLMEGDQVTLIGIIGCYNTPQLRVVDANDIQYGHAPTLTATPASISGLTYDYENGGPSEIASFTLEGNYLVGNVSVYPSESFEVSTFAGEGFFPETPALIYIPETGHFYDINIYVRMKAGLEGGTYAEDINIVSQDADTLRVHVTGTVTGGTPIPPTPPTPGDGNYVRISDLSNLTEGSYVVFAARFDDNATDYYAMSNTSSGKPTGVLFTSATADDNEVLPASIVDEESSYYWIVGLTANGYTFTNAAGELIGYGASGTDFVTGGDKTEWNIEISTAGESAMVPSYTGFYVTNVTTTNRGFALNNQHNYGAYAVSNNNSATYNFYLDLFVKTEGGTPPTPTVATPTFMPAAGTYYETQNVSITCATEGATIYYSTISENGPWSPYTEAITVDESMTIWAYAMMEGYNDSNIAEATYIIQVGVVTIFNQDWEGEMNGWTFVDVEGEMSWTVAQYSGNHYAYANGYNHGANIDWCISPAFNLNTIGNPVLSFRTAKNYTGPDLEVFFSNDYDGEHPATATWTPLTCALSSGSWTWTESGDISLGSFSGTNCYIGFKYTCEEGSAAGWEVDDIMLVGQTSDPVVTVTPLALSGFTYVEGNGPSDEQSFTISGFNLTGNITITAPTHYEISQTSGSGFTQSPITLAPVGGNVEETTIYVRLKAGLAVGTYNDEDITVSCADVDDIEVTCSGNVSAQPVPGDDYVRISDAGQLVAGNRVILAARYNETTDAYVAIQNTLTGGKLATTEFTSVMNGTDEIIPTEIISIENDYYWTIDITDDGYTFTNASGDVIGYNSSTNFNMNGEKTDWTITAGTSDEGAMVPNYYGFNI